MKLLYISVFSHIGWGAEYWMDIAFRESGVETDKIDYRAERNDNGTSGLRALISERSRSCDAVLLQRGDKLPPDIFNEVTVPIIFWSTEPIKLKNDVDNLLKSNIFSWIYVHSYSCLERVKSEFNHNMTKTGILHNAAPKEVFNFNTEKTTFAIFNRTLSLRRRMWLWPSGNRIVKIKWRFGEGYFKDLRDAQIAVNIHYSGKNTDDFETGIFEAMASGCAIVSESLNTQTLIDLGLEDSILQVRSPRELKKTLIDLHEDRELLWEYQKKSMRSIVYNSWNERAIQIKKKIEEFFDK